MRDYQGPDRRRHKLYVTMNTEYHFRDEKCVGVRDLRSGRWNTQHGAIGSEIRGAINFREGRMYPHLGLPRVGESMVLLSHRKDIVTSPVTTVDRPPKEVLKNYCL